MQFMKPALTALLVLALLSGLAFAQAEVGGGSLGGLFILLLLVLFIAAVMAALIILPLIAIALWRNEKDGSVRKRLADFGVQVAFVTSLLLILLAILVFVIYSIVSIDSMATRNILGAFAVLVVVLVPTGFAMYLSRKYYPKTSTWKSRVAAFLFTPLLILLILALFWFILLLFH
jgi:hypothetical protein